MRIVTILVLVLMIIEMILFSRTTVSDKAQNDEVVIVNESTEEAAAGFILSILAADEDDKLGQEQAESFINTQLGFDPNSEQDTKDKEKIRKAVYRYVNGDESENIEGIKELQTQWEMHIPNDKEREEHQFSVSQKIKKLHSETIKVFYGTKAYFKVKQIEKLTITKEE